MSSYVLILSGCNKFVPFVLDVVHKKSPQDLLQVATLFNGGTKPSLYTTDDPIQNEDEILAGPDVHFLMSQLLNKYAKEFKSCACTHPILHCYQIAGGKIVYDYVEEVKQEYVG